MNLQTPLNPLVKRVVTTVVKTPEEKVYTPDNSQESFSFFDIVETIQSMEFFQDWTDEEVVMAALDIWSLLDWQHPVEEIEHHIWEEEDLYEDGWRNFIKGRIDNLTYMRYVPVWRKAYFTPPLENDSSQTILVRSKSGEIVYYSHADEEYMNQKGEVVDVRYWRYLDYNDIKGGYDISV